MSQFVNELKKFDDFIELGGVSQEEINYAENILEVKFSDEYIDYLLECGVASADGHEFTGICKSKRLNVVDVTKEELAKVEDVPQGAYVVEQAHIDGVVVWQTQNGEIYKSQNKKIQPIGNSLCEYINLEEN